MTTCRPETFQLPTHWASYFINADPTGLDNADHQAADGWWEETFQGQSVSCAAVSDEEGFAPCHDADRWCLPCMVATFSFLIHQEG